MLFVTGNPNIVERTRFLAGDPSTSPNPLFSTQEVKDAINIEYLELYDLMRHEGAGWGSKRTYATSVADQILYAKPSDWVHFLSVEIEPDGKDITSDSSASPILLKPRSEEFAMEAYNVDGLSNQSYYFMQDKHFGIVSPPGTGGANALRLTYAAEATALSADGDAPIIPTPHHDLLCYRAAISLLVSKALPIGDKQFVADRKEARFLRAVHDVMSDDDLQIPVAGTPYQSTAIKQGRIIRK